MFLHWSLSDIGKTEGKTGGHGGTDYLELVLFLDAVRNKTQTPLDVYDSVVMCVTGPLLEQSITAGSVPVPVPDFTRGKWKTRIQPSHSND